MKQAGTIMMVLSICIDSHSQTDLPLTASINASRQILFTNVLSTNALPARGTNWPLFLTNQVSTNRIIWTTNVLSTNQPFFNQETNMLLYYPPPKKPWWRRFRDRLW